MEVTHDNNSISLTSSELADLWNTYLVNNKSKHTIMYAVAQIKDKEIREVHQYALELSSMITDGVKTILEGEKQSLPHGFSIEDVYLDAPKLYSDKFHLYLLKIYSMLGLINYGLTLSHASRRDVRKLFTDILNSSIELSNRATDIALQKGINFRPPNIPTTQDSELAEDKSILGKLIGHQRPINAKEISTISNCAFVNRVVEAQFLSMAQTTKDDEIKSFYNRTRKTLKEQGDTLNKILEKEGLSGQPSLESEILNSTTPVYSDRLSMFFCSVALADVIASYSINKLSFTREDILAELTRLSSEIMLVMKDGTDILIERKWFEEMPKFINKEAIIAK